MKPKSKAKIKLRMPRHLPGDHPHVTMLLNESERLVALGRRWEQSKHPDLLSVSQCYEQGWACAFAAAILRLHLQDCLGEGWEKAAPPKERKIP